MTTVFALTAGAMISRAYRILGNLAAPHVASDDQMTQGILALNAMLNGWQADGINLFRQTQLSLTVGSGAQYVDISPLIQGVEECRWVVQPSPNLYERPMAMYSYVDYMTLPNKQSSTTGGPSVWALDKQVGTSRLWLWPVPTNGGTLNCTAARTVNTVTAATDTVDLPQEWTEGAIYNLADRLMDDEGTAAADAATAQRIERHAAAFYQKLLNFDRPTSVFVRPWGKRGTGRFWR